MDEVARSLTAKQFIEWEAYERLEPFGDRRADWRAASIAQMVFNMAVGKDDRRTMDTFLLPSESEVPMRHHTQPWQEKLTIAKAICASYSVRDKELK